MILAPLAAAGVLLVFFYGGLTDPKTLARALLIAVAVWPGITCLGAAFGSAAGVQTEVSGLTAEQLILTPMTKRTLAAAKILPRARPWIVGTSTLAPSTASCRETGSSR